MNKLEIDKKNLKYNIEKIFKTAKEEAKKENKQPPQIIAVVKINAYGLDIVQFSKYLVENGVDYFAVSTPEEAFILRENGISCKILLLTPVIDKEILIKLIKQGIIITIGSEYEFDLINEIYEEINVRKINAQIKIDTGFSRYGFLYNEPEKLEKVFNNENIEIQGVFTHFSKTLDKEWTNKQFTRFCDVIEYLKQNNIDPKMVHCCNSTAFFKYPKMHLDAVRIGSAWQGRLPGNIGELKEIGILKSEILEIHKVGPGTNVSYTNKYTTKRKTSLATIPLGYLDGINRSRERDTFSKRENLKAIFNEFKNLFKTNRLKVTINGKQCNIVGRLGTHHAIIDVTDIECKEGDSVILDVTPVFVDENIKREYV